MKKRWQVIAFISAVFVFWRGALWTIENAAPAFWPLYTRFLGPSFWSNFDGVYYLTIARGGYGPYQQAFFPLYPLLIRWLSRLSGVDDISVSLFISHVSFFFGTLLFYVLARDNDKKNARWSLMLFLLFPTSFFFAATYTESLFLLLSAFCLYAAKRQWWLLSGISGCLASATRFFGIFLFPAVFWEYVRNRPKTHSWMHFVGICLIPVGLLSYMAYLNAALGDPLAFFHAQPAFGAGRSGNTIIFLPQVLWRYLKIFVSVAPLTLTYAVSLFEFLVLVMGACLLWLGYKRKFRMSYLIYSLAIFVTPTLTGTLSSVPRYILSAFPLFFIFGSVHNTWIKILATMIFAVIFVLAATAFLQGYFIA
ncbi:glycosyltransferase family 39 protein [Candidatus Gottesmanbacteria bacterium]|nr:glycosyltransferase family 39 protein [Candidatus Gottesmanbacteria bacterium]